MNILNQKFDSDEEDEDYVPKEEKRAQEFEVKDDTLKELRRKRAEKEVDDIWAQMLAEESTSRTHKRQKVDEQEETKPAVVAKTSEAPVDTPKPQAEKPKPKDESLEDAAAQALAAIKAMKSRAKEGTVKEKVAFAGGSYEIEREKTEKDIRKEQRLKKLETDNPLGLSGLDALVNNIDNLDKKVN